MQLILVKFYTTINEDDYVSGDYINIFIRHGNKIILNKVFECQEGPLPEVLGNEICFEILCYALTNKQCKVIGKYENICDVKCYNMTNELTICEHLQILGVIK